MQQEIEVGHGREMFEDCCSHLRLTRVADDAERAAIRAHPASVAISLGPRILRGETAAIAGMAVWMAEAGDWLGED